MLPLSPWVFVECQSQEREFPIAGWNSEWFNDGIFREKLQQDGTKIAVFVLWTNDSRNVNNERGEEQRIGILTVGVPVGHQGVCLLT
jgi:hypothetical protein